MYYQNHIFNFTQENFLAKVAGSISPYAAACYMVDGMYEQINVGSERGVLYAFLCRNVPKF